MGALTYKWRADDGEHELRFVQVPGTDGNPYLFGGGANRRPIEVREFHIATTQVTQALWTHVMGSNPAVGGHGPRRPVENVSWDHITEPGGFLDRINASEILTAAAGPGSTLKFRLPSETEWEYAARGGPHWADGFDYSGSNDPNAVAWYGPRWTRGHELACRLLGWRNVGRWGKFRGPTRTHDVATKAPNQLGIYDMSGNVFEWCQDVCVDIDKVPLDGTPWLGPGDERRLRGGCHNNWNCSSESGGATGSCRTPTTAASGSASSSGQDVAVNGRLLAVEASMVYSSQVTRKVTLRQSGDSVSAILPKAMAERLGLEAGDRILAIETDRGILLAPYTPETARALKIAAQAAKKHRNGLRELAK